MLHTVRYFPSREAFETSIIKITIPEKWVVSIYVVFFDTNKRILSDSFQALETFIDKHKAYQFCNYLNGGQGLPFPEQDGLLGAE